MKSQTDRLFSLLSDGLPHRTDEIVAKIYDGGALARVGARIFDIQDKYKVDVKGWKDKQNPKLYWYQLASPPEKKIQVEELVVDGKVIGRRINGKFIPVQKEMPPVEAANQPALGI